MAVTETLAANKLVVVAVGLVVIGGGVTAAYITTGGELPFGEAQTGTVGSVPEGVDFVVYADPGVRSDPTTKDLLNGFIDIAKDRNRDYGGPDDFADIRANVSEDAETDVKLDELNDAVMYGRYPEMRAASDSNETGVTYLGVLLDTEWSEQRFVEIVANGTAYEEGEYEGDTVYVEQPDADETVADTDDTADETDDAEGPTWIGVLGDGRYVIGTERAVKDALDVEAGEASSFGGKLRESYDETRDGYVKFAVSVPKPSEVTPATRAVLTDSQFGAFRNLSTVAGSYYTDGDAIGVQLRLGAGTEDDAEDLQAILEGTFALTEESMRTREMAALIDSTTIEREGTSVVVTFQRPVAEVLDAIEAGIESWSELSQFSSAFGAGESYGGAARSERSGTTSGRPETTAERSASG